MSSPVNPSPRRYRSALRAEQARQTRQRVLDAAARLFVERGYAGTPVTAVAEAAGVSAETIYATFDGKRGLLAGVIDAAIMGPEAVTSDAHQAAWDDVARHPTARARLRAYVALCCAVLARTSPIHHVIRRAADGEPFAVELRARLLQERLASNKKRLRDFVGGEFRDGLTLRRAADRFCALTSPEMHHLVTADLGWSLQAHEAWVAALAEQDLLGPP